MYRIFFFTIILFSNILFVSANIDLKASKMFFFNREFGAIVIGGNEIMLTNDGCNSWAIIEIETQEKLRKVFFSSIDVGWIIGDSSIYKTLDGGYTWDKNITFETNYLHTLFFIDEKKGFVGGEIVDEQGVDILLYNTVNSGQTWESSNVDSILENGILDFSFVQDSIGVAVSYNTLYKSYDSGMNWNKLPINFYVGSYSPGRVQMIDANNILLFGGSPHVVWDGEILLSNDGGLSWDTYGNGQTFMWGINDYFVYNMDSLWVTNGEKIFVTTNKGINWKTMDIKIEEFSFISNNRAYGLSENSILYTENGWQSYSIVDSVLVGLEQNEEIKYSYKLYQNYPNPFNPSTTIKFDIPQREEVKIILLNILGEEIDEIFKGELNSGIHEINYDGSSLSSGIYLYQIITPNIIETRKCILLK